MAKFRRGEAGLSTIVVAGLALLFWFNSSNAAPHKLYGLYINEWSMRSNEKFISLVDKSVQHKINTLVCDYFGEPNGAMGEGLKNLYIRNVKYAKSHNLYLVARIVVFKDGATWETIRDPLNWQKKLSWAKTAQEIGFSEIQFDYVRFEDSGDGSPKKRELIEQFLTEASNTLNIPIEADVFGSVAFCPRPIIGQDLNTMSDHIAAVCPMLYPSHFFQDKKRMSDPYGTMLEGCQLAKKQIGYRPVRLIPYIQGFPMNLSYSGLTLKDYILEQIWATEKAQTNGFFVWEAGSNYKTTWEALDEFMR